MAKAPSPNNSSGWLPWGTSNDKSSDKKLEGNHEDSINSRPVPEKQAEINRAQSTNSFPSLTPSAWLNWTKGRTFSDTNSGKMFSNDEDHSNGTENAIVDHEEDKGASQYQNENSDVSGNYNNDDDNDDDDDEDQKKGNEIEEQVHVTKKSSNSWSFWGSDKRVDVRNNNNERGNGKEPIDKHSTSNNSENNSKSKQKDSTRNDDLKDKAGLSEPIANTIFTSNHLPLPDKNSNVIEGTKKPNLSQDDAVLYKPHTNAEQFKEINTHKNENFKENIIVPDWESCLPNHNSKLNTTSAIFGESSTTNQNLNLGNKIDFSSWRQMLNQVSNKLGFSSQSLTSVVQVDESDPNTSTDSGSKVEKEFNLLYEKTYRLYGRSLAKLPDAKKACLPNFNRYYDNDASESKCNKDSVKGDEEDISISNDPMGNLLINHKAKSNTYNGTIGGYSGNNSKSSRKPEIRSMKPSNLRKIKKILIIGVHGFFPTRMVRPIIGAPKGTSLKFANEAEKSIIRYCYENGLMSESESGVSIQKIALEKEGKLLDRVEFFTEVLKKWENELNNADFIYIASHSQGCVVSIMFLAKLIQLGILKDPIQKRIGILGMAGVNNGPFYGIDKSIFMKAYSAIENESMLELFELYKFTSSQSLVFKESLQIIINANVKLTFIGSINDQLVPLYSALASHVYHPNIYRACYIDHTSQTPPFIQKLVSLCCKLQNLGFFDNNVIKELSIGLAGPLTGNGHSKLYNDGKVYDLGVKFTLDTDDIVIPPSFSDSRSSSKSGLVTSGIGTYGFTEEIANMELPATNQIYIKEYNISKIGTNPFILPWCLRGLLFNIEKNWPNNNKLLTVASGNDIGKNGYDEINHLVKLFENWKPDTKAFKDLKYRLNGMRASKL